MAEFSTSRTAAGRTAAAIDTGLRAHMNKVYGLMSVGMLLTGAAAWAIAGLATTTDPALATVQMGNGTMLTSLGQAIYLSPLKWVVMFAPLAFTKTYSMAAAAGLAVTLIPVLMGYLIRGRIPSEQANPLNRWLIKAYRPLLDGVLRFPKATLVVAALLVLAAVFFIISMFFVYRSFYRMRIEG